MFFLSPGSRIPCVSSRCAFLASHHYKIRPVSHISNSLSFTLSLGTYIDLVSCSFVSVSVIHPVSSLRQPKSPCLKSLSQQYSLSLKSLDQCHPLCLLPLVSFTLLFLLLNVCLLATHSSCPSSLSFCH